MLTIKRVPTVVSNYQDQEETASENSEAGCGSNCLGNCSLPVSKLPLYQITKDKVDLTEEASGEEPRMSFLHDLLLGQWEDRMNRGLFRYDVTSCETKIIPGEYGFIAQLNEGRHLKKRPTEFCIDQVLQPFDEKKFNFTKIGQEEMLFRLDDSKSPSVVAINVSPIEYGHVLLIPRVLDCLPQRIDHESFLLALYVAKEAADPFFRLGYNSLGAFATINHLHFQAYYLPLPFPVEKAPTSRIVTVKGYQDTSYNFTNNNIPFNVLISDCGRRIILFPQCYAEKQALGEVSQELLDTQVNPAAWEISGHIVLKRRKDFEEASEEYAWRVLSEVSISEERFQEVKAYVLEAVGLQKPILEENGIIQEEDSLDKLPALEAQRVVQNCTAQH
ncbi:hypothetical protein WN944_005146 [Citrus x changshan-huyou]|uniref:GDP-D-glucose phosphorylase 1 n=1 Tax=Citrus x changshan-huyou TaxID=2935761 RepID=A0AAP0M7Y6_9ROSI